jgi:hypothetical protein
MSEALLCFNAFSSTKYFPCATGSSAVIVVRRDVAIGAWTVLIYHILYCTYLDIKIPIISNMYVYTFFIAG